MRTRRVVLDSIHISFVVVTLLFMFGSANAELVPVTSLVELEACAESAAAPGEADRTCLLTGVIQGPVDVRLHEDAPSSLTFECVSSGAMTWDSETVNESVADAFRIRIDDDADPEWNVTILNCNLSDTGAPGFRTVQGPVLVNPANVLGTFTLQGVTFVTAAVGLSSIGGGINPRSFTRLRVIDSMAFAPICWDAKSYSLDGLPLVHEFLDNVCIVNDAPLNLDPRVLKIEGATHVISRRNFWAYGRVFQSSNNPFEEAVEHDFENDIFHHRASGGVDTVFLSGSDAAWTVTGGVLEIEGEPGPPTIHRSRVDVEATFVGELTVINVPEPAHPWPALAVILMTWALVRGRRRFDSRRFGSGRI